jgi:LmbE family N-acetylglucosaminyl deacetylase
VTPDLVRRVVVLSPHLDDAVLSLGAAIRGWVRAGTPVLVCTAFTAGPDPASLRGRQRVFGDYATRLAEDDRALDALSMDQHGMDQHGMDQHGMDQHGMDQHGMDRHGMDRHGMDRHGVGRQRWGLREAVWRARHDGLGTGGLRAAFHTPRLVSGFAELPRLRELVEGLLADPEVLLYAPLGVGGHVDHVEVALAALGAALAGRALPRVRFYEDFYAYGEGLRRRHPVTSQDRRPWWQAPGWAAPLVGAGLWLGRAAVRGPGPEHYEPRLKHLTWSCQALPVGDHEDAKLRASAQYRSQLPALGGQRRLERVARRAHRLRGGELVWRAELTER